VLKAVYSPQANLDFAEAVNWYLKHDVATAERFESALEKTVSDLCNDPLRWAVFDGLPRRCRIKHFPYSVFYRATNEHLIIDAISHGRQLPRWNTE
jgi:plasmid stabilization system protein ParE